MSTLLCGVMLCVSVTLAVMYAVSGDLINACVWSGTSGSAFASFAISMRR